jgi:hypothetical protein
MIRIGYAGTHFLKRNLAEIVYPSIRICLSNEYWIRICHPLGVYPCNIECQGVNRGRETVGKFERSNFQPISMLQLELDRVGDNLCFSKAWPACPGFSGSTTFDDDCD